MVLKFSKFRNALIFFLLPLSSWGQCITFHNLPYAHAARFEEAVMVEGWNRDIDYSQRGVQCPQTGTSNEMYEADALPQSEDCLVLTINTPSMTANLPVAVYVHGGSHHHGGGEWALYDSSALAEEEGIVTVNVSFRHGVFGYLYNDRSGDSDLGSRDILCALRWIRQNISDFGGNPDEVTLFGQSSGAQSVAYVLSMAEEKICKRAMVFSAPFGITLSASKAKKHARLLNDFLAEQGVTPQTASADQLVAAEKAYKAKYGGSMPFAPSGYSLMPKKLKCGVEDVMVTYQAQDAAMYVQDFKKKTLEEFGTKGDYSLSKIATNAVFGNGARKYSKYLSRQGVKSNCFVFTYCPPDAHWKAAHGMEMGLLYGPEEVYVGHDLMGTLTVEQLTQLRHAFRKTVADYVRSGVWDCCYGEMVR